MELRLASALAGLFACLFFSASVQGAVVLPKYNVSVDQVSVSGLSSGG